MPEQRVRIGIAGLDHDHVFWILKDLVRTDVEVVGFYEPDRALAERYSARFGFPLAQVYSSLDEMLEAVHPQAVAAFGPIADHRKVVTACAPRGVHVMVEKPLALNLADARAMVALAHQHGTHLLTNFETTWYPTTYAVKELLDQGRIGPLRKVVVHDGHRGPVELGCTPAFLEWLTDPAGNGGGAIVDFGCYGANLITWLMGGAEPLAVTAVTQTLKPAIYPKVDDEATIILEYPQAQGIIQASWNWPISRKDMEVYGQTGCVLAQNDRDLRVRLSEDQPEAALTVTRTPAFADDPFAYLAAVVRGAVTPEPGNLWSPENNLSVMKILDAARESARSGKRISL